MISIQARNQRGYEQVSPNFVSGGQLFHEMQLEIWECWDAYDIYR